MNIQMIKRAGFLFLTAILVLSLTAWKPPPGRQAPTPEQPAGIALAVTITVTNLNDSGPDSLRQAIADAAPDDTITFDSSLSGGTIHLASTLTLSKNVTIDGSALASQITISGDTDDNGTGDVRVFDVNAGVIATLKSLTIIKGTAGSGGGIYNHGTLTVTNCVFSGNSADFGGGIFNLFGTLTVTNSTFSANSASTDGGGIISYSTLAVTNSTFSGNSAGYGGGISNQGTLTVTNSTLSTNSANWGGGIHNFGTLTVTNSTFSGNLTSYGYGGGIHNNGTLNYTNTIIANTPSGYNCSNFGTIGTNINNLVEDGSCWAALYGDPVLGPLAYNGGPTQTTALLVGSPAMDAGDDASCPTTDQRGVSRLPYAPCDIGAYELELIPPTALTVNSLNDPGDGTCNVSECTLREAIALIARDSTIDFDSSLSGGTIHLVSTLILYKNITIDDSALASQITISGDTDDNGTGDVQMFMVSSGVTATLNSLTIIKGNSSGYMGGGGIINGGTLTVTNSIFSSHIQGGIYNTGTLMVTNSTFSGNSGNGGGILNSGTLTVADSTFSGNTGNGAGIYNEATLMVTNSTFSGNSSLGWGTGILNSGTAMVANSTFSNNSAYTGGGIYNEDTLTVTNSTFSGNSAGYGGGIANEGMLTVTNSTFSGNGATNSGGGIRNIGTLNYTNTIIADSTSGGDCVNSSTIGTNTNNLVEDGSCSASLSGDPNLGPLADNGGPTRTMAIAPSSLAYNAGDNASCAATDQRGIPRPQGGSCDIGAFELDAAPAALTVNSPNDPGDGICNVTECTLREAIALIAPDGTIDFDSSLSGGTIHLASTLTLSIDVTIDGSALASQITISGDADNNGTGDVRGFYVDAGVTATMNSLTINLGYTSGHGGGIYNYGTLMVTNSAFSGNNADWGGGIANYSALTVTNSTFSGNTASWAGGIYNEDTLTVTNSTFSGNSASYGDGGGIMNNGGTLTVTNSTFSGNFASSGFGGGVYNGGTLTITNSTFSGNSAPWYGGGIFNGGTLAVKNSTFSANSANSSGGGIHSYGTLTVTNSTFSGNSALWYGGGIAQLGVSTLTVTNSTFSGNSAYYGGGIYNYSTLNFANTILANSTSGGDCYNDGTISTNTNNLVEDGSCSASLSGDPNLGALADNGGPTQTMALLGGSPAINAGDDTTCAADPVNNLDQRGVARPQGAHCDIGAYEYEGPFNQAPTDIALSNSSVDEDQPVGTLVGNFSTTDPDAGDTFTYTLVSGAGSTDNASFQINGSQLQINAVFDFETKSSYSIRVRTTDSGGLWYEDIFTITVTDVNEIPTDIVLSKSSVDEDQPVGTLVGNFSTTDPDAGDTFTYTLVSGAGSTDNASFQINGSQLQTNAVFDFETKNTYSIRIRTTDSGGLSFDRQFTITITDVNEDPTGLGLSPASIVENSPIGTVVGTFTTTDPDAGDTFTYSMVSGTGDTDNASFTIVDDELQTAAVFDFETKSSYSIRVRTTDSGGLWYEEAFTITVTDVNETPTDIALSNSSVDEDQPVGTLVGNFSTTDPNAGDTHTYSLVAGAGDTDNAQFSISGNQLLTSASFDFETKTSYSIRVRTTDSGGLWYEEAFTITVTDVNETPTDIALDNSSVTENQPVGTLVGNFSTTDPDAGDTFTYTLVSGAGSTDNASFQINGSQLQTNAVFDFETKTTYSIRVRTTDSGGLWYEEIFTITVTDVNETPTGLTINSLNDPGDGTCNVTECTLREAIALIAPDGTIDFDSSLSGGTIHLASTLTLSKNVTIDNSALASQITISGDADNNGTGDVRVFYVNAGVTATLNSLTITKGYTSGNGGGIYNGGTLTLDASTVSANSADYNGGGIWNSGTLSIQNASKLLANTATNDGDAVFNEKNSTNAVSVTGSCIVNNGNVVFFNNQSASQTATGNWWGNATGPGPVGTGVGDTVSANVDTSGYLTAPILGCPSVTRSALAASKALAKPTIPLNTTTKLTVTLTNPNAIPINSISFTDALPAGLTASTATASQCGGAVNISTPSQIVFTGGSLAANDDSPGGPDTCAINVTVRGIAPGIQTNASFAIERTGLPDGYSNATSITVYKTLQFRSSGIIDGWVLESSETSNAGGAMNVAAMVFYLGDDASNRQYRAILSFDTSDLPDDAVITKVTLKIKKQGLLGSNPFTTHQGLLVDIKKPYFGTGLALAVHDFQAIASKSAVGTFGTTASSGWYSVTLLNKAYPYINRTGTTQLRLRFTLDDDNDNTADYMKFFSGNYGTTTDRPVLVIQYYLQ